MRDKVNLDFRGDGKRGIMTRSLGTALFTWAKSLGTDDMERRLHTRHRARTVVYVSIPGRPGKLCRARNLSANGVFIETENLGLKKGATVQLAFAINLGVVTKIHRRTAIVAHVSRGGTGLMMESLTGTR